MSRTSFGANKIGYRLPEPMQFVSLIVNPNPNPVQASVNLANASNALEFDRKQIVESKAYKTVKDAKDKVQALSRLIDGLDFAAAYYNQIAYSYGQDDLGHPMSFIAAQQFLYEYAVQYGAISKR